MSKLEYYIEKIFKFLASLKLAVIVILSLATVSAVGTIVEARYDAIYAQKIVYHSTVMYLIMALLCINLFNVMIDRLPWKRHHAGFIFAHIGIILLVVGSLVTRLWGVDGSLPIDIGKKNRYVLVPAETEFAIYSSLGGNFERMHFTVVDFLLNPPQEESYTFNLGSDALEINEFHYAALRKESIVADNKNEGGAVRLQLQNDNVNLVEWILRDRKRESDVLNLGPARIHLSDVEPNYQGENEIYLVPAPDQKSLNYFVFTKSQGGLTKKGKVQAGDEVDVGWMGLKLRILKFLPQARYKIDYEPVEKPNDLTTSALKIHFRGEDHWLGLNAPLRLYTEDRMYVVSYANRRIDLGFDIQLDKFNVGRYQGTMRAASYASDVQIPMAGLKAHISMNNPLKYGGYTFYQASFQEDETGKPTTSILSVNMDPGRWIKYLGSLLIVLGTIIMFYFKRLQLRKKP